MPAEQRGLLKAGLFGAIEIANSSQYSAAACRYGPCRVKSTSVVRHLDR